MGYCISLVDSKFTMKADKVASALKALKALAKTKNTKNLRLGFVETEDVISARTLTDALEAMRWSIELNDNGDVIGIEFIGEKLADDMAIFQSIAPYVEAGSFLEIAGEDHTQWRWVFDGKKVAEKSPKVSWD